MNEAGRRHRQGPRGGPRDRQAIRATVGQRGEAQRVRGWRPLPLVGQGARRQGVSDRRDKRHGARAGKVEHPTRHQRGKTQRGRRTQAQPAIGGVGGRRADEKFTVRPDRDGQRIGEAFAAAAAIDRARRGDALRSGQAAHCRDDAVTRHPADGPVGGVGHENNPEGIHGQTQSDAEAGLRSGTIYIPILVERHGPRREIAPQSGHGHERITATGVQGATEVQGATPNVQIDPQDRARQITDVQLVPERDHIGRGVELGVREALLCIQTGKGGDNLRFRPVRQVDGAHDVIARVGDKNR